MAAIIIGTVMGKINKGTVNWLDRARLENIAPESKFEPYCKQYKPKQNRDTRTDDACVKKAENIKSKLLLLSIYNTLIHRHC